MGNYKKRYFLITALIISLLIPVLSYASDISFFGTRGELWKKMKPVEKFEYLQGLYDGLAFAELKIQGEQIATKTSYTHIIGAIDHFYFDYKNELIPIPHALLIISMELSGKPAALIERKLKELRNIAYSIEDKRRKTEY
jgi:hypothetical protein